MAGTAQMTELLNKLRMTPFANIGTYKVIQFEDYLTQKRKDEQGEYPIALPPSDVVKFYLNDGSSITIRPSGTEPKCKFYYSAVGSSESIVKAKIPELHQMFCKTYKIDS
jgi:phosphoglucomutase